jgi:hypothetical protein
VVYTMKIRDKETGEVIDLGEGVLEIENAFLVPSRYYLKSDYEVWLEGCFTN